MGRGAQYLGRRSDGEFEMSGGVTVYGIKACDTMKTVRT